MKKTRRSLISLALLVLVFALSATAANACWTPAYGTDASCNTDFSQWACHQGIQRTVPTTSQTTFSGIWPGYANGSKQPTLYYTPGTAVAYWIMMYGLKPDPAHPGNYISNGNWLQVGVTKEPCCGAPTLYYFMQYRIASTNNVVTSLLWPACYGAGEQTCDTHFYQINRRTNTTTWDVSIDNTVYWTVNVPGISGPGVNYGPVQAISAEGVYTNELSSCSRYHAVFTEPQFSIGNPGVSTYTGGVNGFVAATNVPNFHAGIKYDQNAGW